MTSASLSVDHNFRGAATFGFSRCRYVSIPENVSRLRAMPNTESETLWGHCSDFDAKRIGTGQLGQVFRIQLDYGTSIKEGPNSVVLKIAASEETKEGRL